MRNVRIITYGYDADIARFLGRASKNTSLQHAENLIQDLHGIRKAKEQVALPILLILLYPANPGEAGKTNHFHLSQSRWNTSEASPFSARSSKGSS